MADEAARPQRVAPEDGDDLRDVSAELSALLAELARTPEATVDVAAGWTPRLEPGDVVGRFELKRELGRGGFGVVYEALDRELGRTVAFKAIRPGRRISGWSEEWLRAEAEAVARLNHPNIVTLHDFGRGPSGPYLIFEMLRGNTLQARLRDGARPLREALRIGIDVARVLAHAHRAGVVHRDLKPGNVFLCEDGTVKVLDFGLAFLFGRGGPVSGGTPAYMAPEQWRSSPGDERSDLFALGVLLHQMIAGAVPYRVEREHSEALEPGPPPSLPKERAPRRLRRLVSALLEKDPAARPGSAQAVLDALLEIERSLDDRGRRRRRGAWLAALATAALAGALALWWWRGEIIQGPGPRLVVAVADFENATGDQELDGLSGLLVTSLEQSRRFQVLTRSRLLALMRQVGKGDAARIDEGIARQIAQTAGVRVLLLGSAQRLDGTYTLELKGLDPSADRYLFTMREIAPAKADVFGAIDRLSSAVRRKLRERAEDIRIAQIRITDAVTSNAQAYQAYFEGVDCMERPSAGASWVSVDRTCAAHFRDALALDPTFTLAHYQLAYLLGNANINDLDLGAHASAALRYIDRVPEKEVTLIRAWKAHLDGRDDEALELYGTILARFPDDKQALSMSGDIHVQRGDVGAAVPFFEKLVSLDPAGEWPLDSLVNALGALKRRDDLHVLLSRVSAWPVTPATIHARVHGLAWLGDVRGSVEAARDAVQQGLGRAAEMDLVGALAQAREYDEVEARLRRRIAEDPGYVGAAYQLANAIGTQGRRAEGIRVLDAISQRYPAADQGEVQFVRAMYVADDAVPQVRWREAARAVALAPKMAGDLAIPLALRGDRAHAEQLALLLPKRCTSAEIYAAIVEWRDGDAAGAAARLVALEARDPLPWSGFAPAYLLAEVSADLHDWRGTLGAVERFRGLWPRRMWRSWAVPRTIYLAALAHAELGERDAAQAELEALSRLWARADPGLPLVRDVLELRARLQR